MSDRDQDQIPDQIDGALPGWREILYDLHEELSVIYPNYEVIQVKEKFGGLRVYINHFGIDDEKIRQLEDHIRTAEHRCAYTCELCGARTDKGARLPKGKDVGWYKTFCDMCRDGATGVSTPNAGI